jgi:hypothetical protein
LSLTVARTRGLVPSSSPSLPGTYKPADPLPPPFFHFWPRAELHCRRPFSTDGEAGKPSLPFVLRNFFCCHRPWFPPQPRCVGIRHCSSLKAIPANHPCRLNQRVGVDPLALPDQLIAPRRSRRAKSCRGSITDGCAATAPPRTAEARWPPLARAASIGLAWSPSGPHSPHTAGQQAEIDPIAGDLFFFYFWIPLNARNRFQLLKSVESCIKIIKIENKFLWNPCA